jgi:hypothetical protein
MLLIIGGAALTCRAKTFIDLKNTLPEKQLISSIYPITAMRSWIDCFGISGANRVGGTYHTL